MLRFKKDDGTDYPEWEEKKIGECCEINPKTEILDDKFYYIDLESVTNGSINLKAPINKLDAPSRAQRVLNVDDVLFQTVRPYQMNHYHFKELNDIQTVASTGFAQMKLKNGLNKFLYQVLYSNKFNYNVNIRCTGSNYPAINSTELSSIKISIPSIEEQQKIADFLSSVDQVISYTEKELENLELQKKGAIQKIFSQEVRFKADDGSEYPEWEEKKLGEIANVTKLAGFEFTKHVKYSDEGSIIALRGLNVKNGQLILDDVKYIDESNFDMLKRSKLYKGDLLFTYVGTLGELAIVPNNDQFYLAPNVARIRFINNSSSQFMLYQMTQNVFFNKRIFPLITKSSQPSLSMENIREFVIVIPCLEEQQKIADFLSSFDSAIDLTRQELEQWKLIKKGLLQQMFK